MIHTLLRNKMTTASTFGAKSGFAKFFHRYKQNEILNKAVW